MRCACVTASLVCQRIATLAPAQLTLKSCAQEVRRRRERCVACLVGCGAPAGGLLRLPATGATAGRARSGASWISSRGGAGGQGQGGGAEPPTVDSAVRSLRRLRHVGRSDPCTRTTFLITCSYQFVLIFSPATPLTALQDYSCTLCYSCTLRRLVRLPRRVPSCARAPQRLTLN